MCRADQARIVELVKEIAGLRAENKRLEAEAEEITNAALDEIRALQEIIHNGKGV